MIELQFDSFGIVQSFFENKKQYIPALSVIHGNYPGRVFVDNEQSPSIAVVWAINRWLYIEGKILSDKIKNEINHFLKDSVIFDCKKRNENWFEIYTSDSKQWDELFLNEIKYLNVNKHFESVYTLDINNFNKVRNVKKPKEGGLQIAVRDYLILPESFFEFAYVKEQFKTCKSVEVEIKNGNYIISTCKNNGLFYRNEYFIDVDTLISEERGKGYATMASIKLIEFLLERKMYPLWETTHDNLPSHKLALKLGFEVNDNYPVYAFMIKK